MAGALAVFFLVIEFGLFGANLPKIPRGGWFPLVVAGLVYVALSTWKEGRALLGARLAQRMYPFDKFLKDIAAEPPYRVPGTAIFMTSNLKGTPPTLLHNLEHNRVLHERVILLTVATSDVPYVADEDRSELEPLGQGFYRLALRYGFMQEPDVPAALRAAATPDFPIDIDRTTFFLGVETLLASAHPAWRSGANTCSSCSHGMPSARRRSSRFRRRRVVEIGIQVELWKRDSVR